MNKEKYPEKRGYATGKLQKYLALANLTKRFRNNAKKKGNKEIVFGFMWSESNEGFHFWNEINKEFELYKKTGKVFHVYE